MQGRTGQGGLISSSVAGFTDLAAMHLGGRATFTTAPFGLVNPRASRDWVWGCQKYWGRVPGVPGQKVALPETRPQERAPSRQCCCIEKNSKHARFSAPADCPGALDPPARLGLGSGANGHWQACPLPAQRALCAHYLTRPTSLEKACACMPFFAPKGSTRSGDLIPPPPTLRNGPDKPGRCRKPLASRDLRRSLPVRARATKPGNGGETTRMPLGHLYKL